jgi:hypothetical protein
MIILNTKNIIWKIMYASKLNVYSTMPFLSLKKLEQIMEKFMSIVYKVYLVVQLSVLPI